MPPDLPGALGLVVVALAAAFLFVPRWLRRVAGPAGTAAVSPARIPAAGETAVPVITDAPYREERQAFAYDNGLTVGPAKEGGTS